MAVGAAGMRARSAGVSPKEKGRDANPASAARSSQLGGRRPAAVHLPRHAALGQRSALPAGPRGAQCLEPRIRGRTDAENPGLCGRLGRCPPRARPGERVLHRAPPAAPRANSDPSRRTASGGRPGGSRRDRRGPERRQSLRTGAGFGAVGRFRESARPGGAAGREIAGGAARGSAGRRFGAGRRSAGDVLPEFPGEPGSHAQTGSGGIPRRGR